MPLAIPPVLLLALGAVGTVAVTRWLVRESRRVNAKLHPRTPGGDAERQEPPISRLRRDPVTGGYRPE
jgi:hypothetical protein